MVKPILTYMIKTAAWMQDLTKSTLPIKPTVIPACALFELDVCKKGIGRKVKITLTVRKRKTDASLFTRKQ